MTEELKARDFTPIPNDIKMMWAMPMVTLLGYAQGIVGMKPDSAMEECSQWINMVQDVETLGDLKKVFVKFGKRLAQLLEDK